MCGNCGFAQGTERVFLDDDSPTSDARPGIRPATLFVLAGGLAVFAWITLTWDNGSTEATDTAVTEATSTTSPADTQSETVIETASAREPGALPRLFHIALVFPGSSDLSLVLLFPDQLMSIDVRSGIVTNLEMPEPAVDEVIAPFGDGAVYVGDAGAWIVGVDGAPLELFMAADHAMPCRLGARIWLGNDLTPDRHGTPVEWLEFDADGQVTRSMVRMLPFPMRSPGITWGDAGIYILDDDPDGGWRFLARGFPVAEGTKDLIMTECDPSGECGRVWYDLDTGQDRGALFADLAEAFEPNYLGLISPDGRFVLSRSSKSPGIWKQATGELVESRCTTDVNAVWASTIPVLACLSPGGVTMYDMDAELIRVLDLDAGELLSMTFVEPR